MKGFNLFEMLIVIFITGVLLSVSSVVYLANYKKHEDDNLLFKVSNLIREAQAQARLHALPVALCKAASLRCQNLGQDLLIFLDPAQRGELTKENVLNAVQQTKGYFQWRFYPKQRIFWLFFANDFIANDNGTIWYCREKKPRWAIFLSQTGNIKTKLPDQFYHLHDARGKKLTC